MARLFSSPVTQVKFLLRTTSLASEVGSRPVMCLSSVVISVPASSEPLVGGSTSFYCSRWTWGQTDRRRCAGPGRCSWMGRLWSEAWPWQPDPPGFRRTSSSSRLFLAPSCTRQVQENVHASPTAACKVYLSLRPGTPEVVMEMSKCLDADAPTGSDGYTPVSVSPLTAANQDSGTQKQTSANGAVTVGSQRLIMFIDTKWLNKKKPNKT